MKQVKITIIKKVYHKDLALLYELPQINPCPYNVGDTYIFDGYNIPKGICQSAWLNIYPYALSLSSGSTNLFDNWMINKKQAVVSCNDGIRPVSFLLEAID